MLPSCESANGDRSLSHMTCQPTSGRLTVTSVTTSAAVEDVRFSLCRRFAIAVGQPTTLASTFGNVPFVVFTFRRYEQSCFLVFCSFNCKLYSLVRPPSVVLCDVTSVVVRPTSVVLRDVTPGSLAVWTCLLSKLLIKITYK